MSFHNRERKRSKWAQKGIRPHRSVLVYISPADVVKMPQMFEPDEPRKLNPLGRLLISHHGKRNLKKILAGQRSILCGSSAPKRLRSSAARALAVTAADRAGIEKRPISTLAAVADSTSKSTLSLWEDHSIAPATMTNTMASRRRRKISELRRLSD